MSLAQLTLQIGKPVIGSLLIFVSLCVFWFGTRLARGSISEYDRNRNRTRKSLKNVLWGTVPTWHDGTRDEKVSAGIAIDLKNNRWVEQGRLSDEALEDVLAP
jgi:hypothetical protein